MAWRTLCFAAAILLVVVAHVPDPIVVEAQADLLPAQLGLAIYGVRRCPHCGWIEERHENQYTVRMVDGTSRVFQETLPATWRLGERLIVIDGTDPLE